VAGAEGVRPRRGGADTGGGWSDGTVTGVEKVSRCASGQYVRMVRATMGGGGEGSWAGKAGS
jgi:hypothetical protein